MPDILRLMVSLLRIRGRAPLCLFSLTLAAAGLTGCDSGSDSGGDSGSTSGSEGSTSTDPSTTATPTGSSSGGTPTSSTTDDSTTGTTAVDESSTGDAEGSSSTGEACEPGTQNCPCGEGDSCDDGLECIDGTCYDPAGCQGKQQDTEPNEDEASAQDLGTVGCGALSEVMGSSEPSDVDYFRLDLDDLGEDCPASDGTIAIATSTEELEVCMFFSCNAGAASVNCGANTDATSPDGLPGCCGTDSVEPDFFCSGVNNDSEVFLRVGELDANMCIDYALAYRVL